MSWACDLTDDAKEDLKSLPKPIQKRVARVVEQMRHDPFQGDVKALHGGEWKGRSAVASEIIVTSFFPIGRIKSCTFSVSSSAPISGLF